MKWDSKPLTVETEALAQTDRKAGASQTGRAVSLAPVWNEDLHLAFRFLFGFFGLGRFALFALRLCALRLLGLFAFRLFAFFRGLLGFFRLCLLIFHCVRRKSSRGEEHRSDQYA